MNLNYVYYKDCSRNEWNELVIQIEASNWRHSWNVIDYYSKKTEDVENMSYVCIGDKSIPIAVVIIIITKRNGQFEFSNGGNPIPSPVIADLHPSARKKLWIKIWNRINLIVKKWCLNNISFIQSAISIGINNKNIESISYLFELLPYTTINTVYNNSVIDLNRSTDLLKKNLSKYQRKNINKGYKNGVTILVYNSNENSKYLEEKMVEFQNAHYKSAGVSTRPKKTWDAMLDTLKNREGSLFIAIKENEPISYLFCGEFINIAFGWTQVNIEKFEKVLPVRHILEWEAILYYKNIGFNYYEIGPRFYESNLFYKPTEKQISISEFKDRYGGGLYPQITWYKYYNKNLLNKDINDGINQIID